MINLTHLQQLVLEATADVDWLPRTRTIPNGVYRALMLRGLIEHNGVGYKLTKEGRLKIETLRHAQDAGFHR